MTVAQAIIKWLMQFKYNENASMEKIDTERQSAEEDTYSIVRAPVQNVTTFLSGSKLYTDHYTIQARLSSQTDADRIDNNGFGEALEQWVWEMDEAGNYPDVPNAEVQSVAITTPFYVGKADDNSYVYQMTIAIEYEKER